MNNQALQKSTKPATNLVALESGRNALAGINMRDLRELADVFMASGAFPDIKSVAQAQVKILAGAELGFSAIVSMTGIHFFQGKVSIGANLLASLIKDSGKYEYKILQHTTECCEIAFYQRIGDQLKSLGTPVFYTTDDAMAAGLLAKDNWKKFRKDMLFAACIRQGARRYCADILRGTSPEVGIETLDEDGPIDPDGMDTSAMDDATAQNVTVDAEAVEAVDMATGEVIEVESVPDHVEPEVTAEAPKDNDLDPATEDLRSLVAELMSALSATRQKDVLVGRPSVAKSSYDELMELKAVLEK